MKIGGIDPRTLPNEVFLVLPRGEQNLVFKARGVPNYDEFDELCSEPSAPKKMVKGQWVVDEDNTDYQEMVKQYNKRRMDWLTIRSLEPSEIEWDSVDVSKPSTWQNWRQDLLDGGLSIHEIGRVAALVLEANSLDEDKLKEARDFFVRGQMQAPNESSGPSSEPGITPSGEPA